MANQGLARTIPSRSNMLEQAHERPPGKRFTPGIQTFLKAPRRREAATKRITKQLAKGDHMAARPRVGPKRPANNRRVCPKCVEAVLVGHEIQTPAASPLPDLNQVRAPSKFAADDRPNAAAKLGKIDPGRRPHPRRRSPKPAH